MKKTNNQKSILRNQRGQGATEYILLLVVVVGLVAMFGPRIKTQINNLLTKMSTDMSKVEN